MTIERDNRLIAAKFASSAISPSYKSLTYAWMLCFMGMLFYCFNYFLRVSPGVMEQTLTQTFHISATEFGTLAGMYYWAYTPMQLPAGLIYDRFGARHVLFAACLVTAGGFALFLHAQTYFLAGIGRLLIGFGAAFSYIGVLKLAALWLPENCFATAAGLTTAMGMACGALTQKYLSGVIIHGHYQQVLQHFVFLGVLLSLLIFLGIRNHPEKASADSMKSLGELFSALKAVIHNRQTWLIGIISGLLYLPVSVFLDLWGIPWLQTAHHLDAVQAVSLANMTFAGCIFASPFLGILSDRIGQRRLPLMIAGTVNMILLFAIFYVPNLSLAQLHILFFMTGLSCGSHALCFALGKESSPAWVAGTTIAVINMLIMSGGAIFQPLIGKMLDWHATGILNMQGLPVYSAADYRFALTIIPCGVLTAILLSFFIRETHGKKLETQ